MDTASFYRRLLPDPAIAFSSIEGRQIFQEALALEGLAGYFPLAEQFHTQADPAFCSLGTLVILLNALSIDPQRVWKGVWRWYAEEFLDCCQPLPVVKNQGITFDEFVCLARCNGAIAAPSRYHQSSLAQFRATVQQVCSTPEGIHLVAAYSRQLFGQTGDGHFSPIGGYHAPRDLVLLLDVARFKYPPHWVPLTLLWQVFEPLDPATNQCRGYITLRKNNNLQDTVFQIALDLQAWSKMAPNFAGVLPTVLEGAQPDSPVAAVSIILQNFPEDGENIVGWAIDQAELPQALQQAIWAHRLFNVVEAALALPGRGISQWSRLQHSRERLTLLLLSCPDTLYQTLNPTLQTWFREARQTEQMEPLLAREIFKLREQMAALQDLCQVQSLKPSARAGA